MIVTAHITIHAPKARVWAAIADIAHAAETVSGIQDIEIVEKPASGLLGLKWRETRILFDKPATVEKWITDAADNAFYTAKAQSDGFVFLSTKRLSESDGITTLTDTHESIPQSLKAKIMVIPMALFFKGAIRKAVLQDLNDFKASLE
ncbi:MAG TPA: SRPBCC family protein [Telluria sp.]|nr:SRPBCC family protein [Telluria sp.]